MASSDTTSSQDYNNIKEHIIYISDGRPLDSPFAEMRWAASELALPHHAPTADCMLRKSQMH